MQQRRPQVRTRHTAEHCTTPPSEPWSVASRSWSQASVPAGEVRRMVILKLRGGGGRQGKTPRSRPWVSATTRSSTVRTPSSSM